MSKLDASVIRAAVDALAADRLAAFEAFAEIESTNSHLMSSDAPAPGRLRVALTDNQTAGRGRHGRTNRLIERQIQKARLKGELNNLPGEGAPLPERPGDAYIDPGLAAGFRVMAEAGVVPQQKRGAHVVGQPLHLVDHLTTAVISFAGPAFSIFVSQYAPGCFHDSAARVIFTGDQLQPVVLTPAK